MVIGEGDTTPLAPPAPPEETVVFHVDPLETLLVVLILVALGLLLEQMLRR